jgi:phosphate transport system protein
MDRQVAELFSLVIEAMAAATDALLSGEAEAGTRVVAGDAAVDRLTTELVDLIWQELGRLVEVDARVRRLVSLLLVLPELERSADLAEHIAQRAVTGLGPSMSPTSRGVVQRMSEVALEMWHDTARSFLHRDGAATALDEADEELDILHGRLAQEVASSSMAAPVAAQVTLLGRFYERFGDHAVNLARRLEGLPENPA